MNQLVNIVLQFVSTLAAITAVLGHGILWDPPNRSSLWRFGYDAPVNYDDNELFCGGITAQMGQEMKCGLCGDPVDGDIPRENEIGGLYGLGIITRVYPGNGMLPVTVNLETEHRGYFEFHLCNLDDEEKENETCFEKLFFDDDSDKFYVNKSQFYYLKLQLPLGLICHHCVLRWHYKTGNNWGVCENGTQALGCGPQEVFRNCADISVV